MLFGVNKSCLFYGNIKLWHHLIRYDPYCLLVSHLGAMKY